MTTTNETGQLWSLLMPDELLVIIFSGCDSMRSVALARLVCRRWSHVGQEAIGRMGRRWAAEYLSASSGCDPQDHACSAVYSAVAFDQPQRLRLLLDVLPEFDLGQAVAYRPIIEARGHARLTGHYQPTRFSVPRPHHPLYGCYVPVGRGLLAFAVGCGAVRCVEMLATMRAPVYCTREALVWSALWASTRSWRVSVYDPRPQHSRNHLWRTVARLPPIDGMRLIDAVLALPLEKAAVGTECIRPLHALLIVTGHTRDDLGQFWQHRSQDAMTAWSACMLARFVRAGYEPDDPVRGDVMAPFNGGGVLNRGDDGASGGSGGDDGDKSNTERYGSTERRFLARHHTDREHGAFYAALLRVFDADEALKGLEPLARAHLCGE